MPLLRLWFCAFCCVSGAAPGRHNQPPHMYTAYHPSVSLHSSRTSTNLPKSSEGAEGRQNYYQGYMPWPNYQGYMPWPTLQAMASKVANQPVFMSGSKPSRRVNSRCGQVTSPEQQKTNKQSASHTSNTHSAENFPPMPLSAQEEEDPRELMDPRELTSPKATRQVNFFKKSWHPLALNHESWH